MLPYVTAHVYPAAMSLLPAEMWEREAFAMLTAIGLQESRFTFRRQYPNGPARGFWQFEMGGVEGVLEHRATRSHAADVCAALGYGRADARSIHLAIEHNDALACCFARLLLWTDPRPLPNMTRPNDGWLQYLATWQPGKPHASAWPGHFASAWQQTVVLA